MIDFLDLENFHDELLDGVLRNPDPLTETAYSPHRVRLKVEMKLFSFALTRTLGRDKVGRKVNIRIYTSNGFKIHLFYLILYKT